MNRMMHASSVLFCKVICNGTLFAPRSKGPMVPRIAMAFGTPRPQYPSTKIFSRHFEGITRIIGAVYGASELSAAEAACTART